MSKKILQFFPSHEYYIEPFGGGASILLAKEPCKHETYNDLDHALYEFFSVLSDPSDFEKFYRRVCVLPYSRELFYECHSTWQEQEDKIERVWRWFVVARMSFSGDFGYSISLTVSSSHRNMAGTTSSFLSCIEGLPEIAQRLRTVQIENNDFRKVLKTYDGDGYLAYCDPPYVHGTRKGGKYSYEMTDDDHKDLIDILLNYRGAVVLSGYSNDLYRPLEEQGWKRHDFEIACHAAGRTRASKIQGEGAATKMQPRTESVWTNPKAQALPRWGQLV